METVVLSGEIRVADVELFLLANGIVVLATSRTVARRILHEMRERLPPDGGLWSEEDDEDLWGLEHQFVDGILDRGWTHFLVYGPTFSLPIGYARGYVRRAIEAWRANGTPLEFHHQTT
ncbi:hypothetical protein [Dyella subtropica]|uniref:hypothetical protein n=1 Tax=Dyella subtropica TaxID=2992127 RepID=UPI00224C9473|nr:hypothetical protein [Dyella subtropica]